MAAANSVSWMFKARGDIRIAKTARDEDSLMEIVLNAGADDLSSDDEEYEVSTSIDAFEDVRAALEKAGITPINAEMVKVPENFVKLEGDAAFKVLRLLDALDELDDTQHVYSNLDVSDEDAEKYAKQ